MDPWNRTEADLKWYDGEDPVALRLRYAQLCARAPDGANRYSIAAEVFSGMRDEQTRCGEAYMAWKNSVAVSALIEDYRTRGREEGLPTLQQWVGGLMADLEACVDPKVRLEIRKLLGEAAGFVGKGGGGGGAAAPTIHNHLSVDNRSVTVQRVPIPLFANDQDNEQHLVQKQAALIEAGRLVV